MKRTRLFVLLIAFFLITFASLEMTSRKASAQNKEAAACIPAKQYYCILDGKAFLDWYPLYPKKPETLRER